MTSEAQKPRRGLALRVATGAVIVLSAVMALLEGASKREPIRMTLRALRCELFHQAHHARVSLDSKASPWISTYQCSLCKRKWRLT